MKRKNNDYDSREDAFVEGVLRTVFTIIVIYILLWVIFWIGIVFVTISILYFVHLINKRLKWYNTRFYIVPITSFLVTIGFLIVAGSQILFNLGKIDKTIIKLAEQTSEYVIIKMKRSNITIDPNEDGIVQKVISSEASNGTN